MAALDLAEDVISRRIAELEKAEQALRDTLAIADQASEKDLLQLTELYQAMKPKDAAALFNGMDPEFSPAFGTYAPGRGCCHHVWNGGRKGLCRKRIVGGPQCKCAKRVSQS